MFSYDAVHLLLILLCLLLFLSLELLEVSSVCKHLLGIGLPLQLKLGLALLSELSNFLLFGIFDITLVFGNRLKG